LKLTEIDARGRSCPEPVLMTKKGIEKNPDGIKVIVDNTTAVENIKRFAQNNGYKVQIEDRSQEYIITLSR
jgi:TusA-related sulfurtransferase